MKKFLEFISYHNAIPIFFGILFLGSGAVFAASPEARQAVFDAEQVVASIDNAYMLSVDISNYAFGMQVIDVSEDEAHYYVAYSFATIDLIDGVWQDVTVQKLLTVSKEALNERDLGVYVTKQLSEMRTAEKNRLLETQEFEQGIGATQKVVATKYSGLVGRMLSSKEETFEGYQPVVKEKELSEPPVEVPTGQVAGAATKAPAEPAVNGQGAPRISILGNNPAQLTLRSTYADLGVLVEDEDENLGVHVFLDGKKIIKGSVSLDTSEHRTYTILYRVTDTEGNIGEATRTVIVGKGTVLEPEVSETLTATSSPETSEPEPPAETPPAIENPVESTPDEEITTTVATSTASSTQAAALPTDEQ